MNFNGFWHEEYGKGSPEVMKRAGGRYQRPLWRHGSRLRDLQERFWSHDGDTGMDFGAMGQAVAALRGPLPPCGTWVPPMETPNEVRRRGK